MATRQSISLNLSLWTRTFVRRLVTNTTRAAQRRAAREASGKDTAVLFVADTRPAMFLGVPHTLGVALIMVFGESIIFIGPVYSMWVLIPWVFARIVVRQDYNAPRICLLWLQTKAWAFDSFTWWGSSPTPFPLRGGQYPRGIWR